MAVLCERLVDRLQGLGYRAEGIRVIAVLCERLVERHALAQGVHNTQAAHKVHSWQKASGGSAILVPSD